MSNTFITIYTDKWQAIRSINAISERERQKLAAALLDYGCLNIIPLAESTALVGEYITHLLDSGSIYLRAYLSTEEGTYLAILE